MRYTIDPTMTYSEAVLFYEEQMCIRDSSGILRYLECMGQPRPVMIALRRQKHLRFVLETPERLAVQDAVSVTLKYRSDITRPVSYTHLRYCPFLTAAHTAK